MNIFSRKGEVSRLSSFTKYDKLAGNIIQYYHQHTGNYFHNITVPGKPVHTNKKQYCFHHARAHTATNKLVK